MCRSLENQRSRIHPNSTLSFLVFSLCSLFEISRFLLFSCVFDSKIREVKWKSEVFPSFSFVSCVHFSKIRRVESAEFPLVSWFVSCIYIRKAETKQISYSKIREVMKQNFVCFNSKSRMTKYEPNPHLKPWASKPPLKPPAPLCSNDGPIMGET